jgi:type VI secretion system secreted protein VgrG
VALASITATTGATINGSLIARTGTVTLDHNTIVNNGCAAAAVVTSPVQTSRVDSVTPADCVTSGPTTVTLNGSFPEKIVNLTVNGVIAAAGTWTQTATKIVITTTPVKTGDQVGSWTCNGTQWILSMSASGRSSATKTHRQSTRSSTR